MARSVANQTFQSSMLATIQNDINEGAQQASCSVGRTNRTTFVSGTTANRFDRPWEERDIELDFSGTASITLDVYDFAGRDIGGGAGNDATGLPMALAEIVGIHISVDADSTGNLIVGGDGTAAAWNSLFGGDDDAVLILPPGTELPLICPSDPAWAVADTTNHLLKLAASAGLVTFSITILGRSA